MNQTDLFEIEQSARSILAAVQNVQTHNDHQTIDRAHAAELRSLMVVYIKRMGHAAGMMVNSRTEPPSESSNGHSNIIAFPGSKEGSHR